MYWRIIPSGGLCRRGVASDPIVERPEVTVIFGPPRSFRHRFEHGRHVAADRGPGDRDPTAVQSDLAGMRHPLAGGGELATRAANLRSTLRARCAAVRTPWRDSGMRRW